ncbi:MAG: hypothetical protein AAF456_20075 [Planctomycetota bacterium]
MIDEAWFSMLGTTPTIIFGVVLVLAVIVVSWITVVRAKFSTGMVVLELFRILLACLIAFMINQPEWLERFIPQEEPVIAVLWDDSDSMNTEDVVEGDELTGEAISRRAFVESVRNNDLWGSIEGVRIEMEPFSSTLDEANRATDINSAINSAVANYQNLRGLVMVSDGDWNIGDAPENAARQCRYDNIPVFTMPVGSRNRLPDVEVTSVDAPTFGIVNKTTRIPYVITNSMARAVDTIVTLRSNDGDEITETIHIDPKSRLESAITWKPKKEGEYTLTLSVPTADDELMKSNNSMEVPITIKKESLKVLVVESYPRWEYRYLRNALSRDPGVEVSCLLYHPDLNKVGGGADYIEEFPQSDEELAKFDVVFLGDVGIGDDQLTVDDCRRIKSLVSSQASGLIFMPGFRGRQFTLLSTPLAELLPVHLDEAQPRGWGSRTPAQFQLTQRGRDSLLTKLADSPEASEQVWRGLPGFQWYAPVLRAKAGSEVLAVHSSDSNINGRIPLLVTKTFGAGKILFMGTDGAWRWREGVEDKYHYRFWGQVARWMAYQRNMASGNSMRIFYTPDRPTSGNLLTLNANVMSGTGEPLQDGNVFVQVISPSGNTERIRLSTRNDEEQWGLFSGSFTPTESGRYELVMTCRENGATLETKIDVQGSERERLGQPARYDVMDQIAKASTGKMVESDELPALIQALSEIPEPEPEVRRLRLWRHWIWATIFVSLLGVFWIGRKMAGVI